MDSRALFSNTDTMGELSFSLTNPILMGFKNNYHSIKNGDSREYTILGETLTTVINYDKDTKTAVMNGNGACIVYYNYLNVSLDASGRYHTPQEGYSLQMGNVAVIETDIVYGVYEGSKMSGAYIHRFKADNTQPNLSVIDFKTITKEEFLAYFDDHATWIGNDHTQGAYLFKNYTDGILYGDPMSAMLMDGVSESPTIPWIVLP